MRSVASPSPMSSLAPMPSPPFSPGSKRATPLGIRGAPSPSKQPVSPVSTEIYPQFQDLRLDAAPLPYKRARPSLSDRTIESLSRLPVSPSNRPTRRNSSFFLPPTNGSNPKPERVGSRMESAATFAQQSSTRPRPATAGGIKSVTVAGAGYPKPIKISHAAFVPPKADQSVAKGFRSRNAFASSDSIALNSQPKASAKKKLGTNMIAIARGSPVPSERSNASKASSPVRQSVRSRVSGQRVGAGQDLKRASALSSSREEDRKRQSERPSIRKFNTGTRQGEENQTVTRHKLQWNTSQVPRTDGTTSRAKTHLTLNGSVTVSPSTPGSRTIAGVQTSRPVLANLFHSNRGPGSNSGNKTGFQTVRCSTAASNRQPLRQAKATQPARHQGDEESTDGWKLVSPALERINKGEMEQSEGGLGKMAHSPRLGNSLIKARVRSGLLEGKLNISAMGLQKIPNIVINMYQPWVLETLEKDSNSSVGGGGISWGEIVDFRSLNASDNDLETIPIAMFPNVPLDGPEQDGEDGAISQFGTLESIDLHGNLLKELPIGMRRLEMLTYLNLSRNRLEMSQLWPLFSLPALRELKLGDNLLSGHLPEALSGLGGSLEVLELPKNKVTGLGSDKTIQKMSRLRRLDVSENQLESMPVQALSKLPLRFLSLANNKLVGSVSGGWEWWMEPEGIFESLETLDLSRNGLRAILGASPPHGMKLDRKRVVFPALKHLDVSKNRIDVLPVKMRELSPKLQTFLAGENRIEHLPEDLSYLSELQVVSLAENLIRWVEPGTIIQGGGPSQLQSFALMGNPIRNHRRLCGLGPREVVGYLREQASEEGGM